jgi:hypothetical protein
MATVTAVTAVWTTSRHVRLTSKAGAPVSTVTGLAIDSYAIDEHD